jgi:hypothetical protein
MAEVFISYRHVSPDQDLAEELSKFLQGQGVSCFRDKEILIGQNWVQMIEKELRACQSFAVLLSSESIRSDMVRQEVKLAHEWRKRILPVRLNYDGAFPYDLAAYLDLIQYKIWQTGEPFIPVCAAVLDGIRGNWTQRGLEPSPEALRRLGEVTELNGAPLPSADPRLPISGPETGGLKLQSNFYVRRADDERVEDLVRRSGETILIKGPRQVGKTSLAARACAAAERNNQRVCYIDLQLLDQSRLRESGVLCRYIAARLAKDFRATIKPADVWDDMLGDADSLTEFIEQAILSLATAPVVLCLDEVDNVFTYSYRDNFFGMLRGWHNRRATRDVWNQFNLLIVHSTEPTLFITDLNQSPFNVGTVIRLSDFDRDEVLWLNTRHGSPLKTAQDLEQLLLLVGGYPYLVRQALYALYSRPMSVADLVVVAARDDGPFGDHLRRHLWSLRENPQLRKALKQVVSSHGCDDEDAFQRLRGAGLIVGETRETAKTRCALYTLYMRDHL